MPKQRSSTQVLVLWIALAVSVGCAGPPSDQTGSEAALAPPSANDTPSTFGVYALSRGKGVPAEARQALEAVAGLVDEDLARGIAVKSERSRIGIEGETRLCVAYENAADAAEALERIRKIVADVDLVNLEFEDCMR